jgi:DNA ligase 3
LNYEPFKPQNKVDIFVHFKSGRAACKKCKNKCETGELRLAKYVPNPFSESGGKVKHWYHLDCLFEVFKKQRAGTKVIESSDDIDGWGQLSEEDRDAILESMQKHDPQKWKAPASVKPQTSAADQEFDATTKDNSFREFRRICAEVANESSYTGKTKILHEYFQRGSNKKKFEGDLQLWIKLLCPSAVPRIYNLQSKQLVKLFAKIFKASHSDMLLDLEQGDVSETVRRFFESSRTLAPTSKSTLTIKDVEDFLEKLSKLTQEDTQMAQLQSISKLCTSNDLLVVSVTGRERD